MISSATIDVGEPERSGTARAAVDFIDEGAQFSNYFCGQVIRLRIRLRVAGLVALQFSIVKAGE